MRPPAMRKSASAAVTANVNLYCAQCDSQIGILANEFLRLTASYARAKDKGIHFATDIGNRTQIVPSGPVQKAAEGCEMSEVFCRKCSSTVGQYCRNAPDPAKQYLVDNYFYKLSRIYLKDVQTFETIDPSFSFDEDAAQRHSARADVPSPPTKEKRPLRPQSASRQPNQDQSENADNTVKEGSRHHFPRSNSAAQQFLQLDGQDPHTMYQREPSTPFRQMYTPTRVGTPYDSSNGYSVFQPAGPYPQPHGFFSNYTNGYQMPPAPSIIYHVSPAPPHIPQSARTQSVPPSVHVYHPGVSDQMNLNADIQHPLCNPTPQCTSSSIGELPTLGKPEDTGGTTSSQPNQDLLQRLVVQETINEKQIARMTYLEDKLEKLHGDLRSAKAALEEMRKYINPRQLHETPTSGILGLLEQMLETRQNPRADEGLEVQSLRAENQSMKAKLDRIASAINPLQTPSPTTTIASSATSREDSIALGKRKRDTSDRQSSIQYEIKASDFGDEEYPPLKRSLGSRSERIREENTSTVEMIDYQGHIAEDDSLFLPGSYTSANKPCIEHNEVIEDTPTESEVMETDVGEEHVRTEDSSICALQSPELHPVSQDESNEQVAHIGDDSLLLGGIDFSDDEAEACKLQHQMGTAAPLCTDHLGETEETSDRSPKEHLVSLPSELPPDSQEPQAVPAQLVSRKQSPRPVVVLSKPDTVDVSAPLTSVDGHPKAQPSIPKPNGRRVTDSIIRLDTRSMAPEPSKRRRVTVNKPPRLIDLEDAYVATPEMIAQKIRSKGRPRKPKPKIQTTEKMLNKELTDLGLEHWIGKDKNSPEYKQVVDSARMRQREVNRIKTLAEKGIVPARDDDTEQQTSVPPLSPAVGTDPQSSLHPTVMTTQFIAMVPEHPSQVKTHASATTPTPLAPVALNVAASSRSKVLRAVSKTAPKVVDHTMAPVVPNLTTRQTSVLDPAPAGVQTRRQQQAEQIRKRDQLAKEAMEREEMGLAG